MVPSPTWEWPRAGLAILDPADGTRIESRRAGPTLPGPAGTARMTTASIPIALVRAALLTAAAPERRPGREGRTGGRRRPQGRIGGPRGRSVGQPERRPAGRPGRGEGQGPARPDSGRRALADPGRGPEGGPRGPPIGPPGPGRLSGRGGALADESADEQVELAHWCVRAGLPTQAEAHLLGAIRADPDHEEARSLLGFRLRADGRWLTDAQAEVEEAEAKAQAPGRRRLGAEAPDLERGPPRPEPIRRGPAGAAGRLRTEGGAVDRSPLRRGRVERPGLGGPAPRPDRQP